MICTIVWQRAQRGKRKAIRITEQNKRESHDVYLGKQMKDTNGAVLIEDNDIRERWRTYFEQLMNMKKDRIERIIATRAESEVESITIDEIERVLTKMKRAKQQIQMTSCGGMEDLDIFNTQRENEKMP